MRRFAFVIVFWAAAAQAVDPAALQRVHADASVIDRVAEVSRRDLPTGLLKRVIEEDIELLRGKRADGSYEYATYERLEAGRHSNSHSVQPRKDDALERLEIRGPWVYRLIISSPSRRLLVTKNRSVFIERVEIEFIPQGATATRHESVSVQRLLERGGTLPIDFPEVAKQATVRVFARADAGEGYGNVVLSLVQARIVDNADSPYADAVASAKAIARAIEAEEVPSIRAMAARLRDNLAVRVGQSPASAVEVIAAPAEDVVTYQDLRSIRDLLDGNENDRRRGMELLDHLVRKLAP